MGKPSACARWVILAGLLVALLGIVAPCVAVAATTDKVTTPVCRLYVSDEGNEWHKTDDAACLEDVYYRAEGTLPSNWDEFQSGYFSASMWPTTTE